MLRFIAVLLTAVAVVAPVHAQTYPSKPIRLIVPFPPGGGTDAVSRIVATELAKSTGWTVVVENKAGGGGMIGLQDAARANNEGYDIVMGQVDNMVIAPAIQKTGNLAPAKDLTPVIQVASSPFLLWRDRSQVQDLQEIVAARKPARQDHVRHGRVRDVHAPRGRAPANGRQLQGRAGAVQGRAPAITDLLGGHIPMAALVDRVGHAAHPGRQGARARRDVGRRSPRCRRADGRRIRLPGFRGERLARHPRSERHAARGHRQAQHRDREGDAKRGHEEGAPRAGRGGAGHVGRAFGALIQSETAKWGKIIADAGIKE
jgi:hypothetical protein